MTKLVATAKSFKRELIPAGLYEAICYSIIDLGTQDVEYKGETKKQRKVMLSFEIPELTKEFDGVKKPLVKSIKFTLSMSDKGNLRKQLTGWMGKDPGDEFDIMSVIGRFAQINIVHLPLPGGDTYDSIDSILPCKNKLTQFNETQKFSFDDYSEDDFDGLHEWIKKILVETPEYKSLKEDFVGGNKTNDGEDLPF